jgi:hypothetical protein
MNDYQNDRLQCGAFQSSCLLTSGEISRKGRTLDKKKPDTNRRENYVYTRFRSTPMNVIVLPGCDVWPVAESPSMLQNKCSSYCEYVVSYSKSKSSLLKVVSIIGVFIQILTRVVMKWVSIRRVRKQLKQLPVVHSVLMLLM